VPAVHVASGDRIPRVIVRISRQNLTSLVEEQLPYRGTGEFQIRQVDVVSPPIEVQFPLTTYPPEISTVSLL